MDVYALERQISEAERDLAEEVRLGEVANSPFVALRCERLYRTVAGLRQKRDELLGAVRGLRPHAVPSRARRQPRERPRAPWAPEDATWRREALDARSAWDQAGEAGVWRRTQRPEEDDPRFWAAPLPMAAAPSPGGAGRSLPALGARPHERWSAGGSRFGGAYDEENSGVRGNSGGRGGRGGSGGSGGVETWDWKGRTVRVVKNAMYSDDELLQRLLAKAEQLQARLDGLDGLDAPASAGASACGVSADVLARGEALGEERVRARAAARESLQRRAEALRVEVDENSAVAVQCVFRGHLGRRKMREARTKHAAEIQTLGATSIQSRFRGHLARRQMRTRRLAADRDTEALAATVIQSRVRSSNARRRFLAAGSAKERAEAAASMIAAWYRGCSARDAVGARRRQYHRERREVAARWVQEAWKGWRARRAQGRLRAEQRRAKEEAAAVMLQAAFRGLLARRRARALRGELRETESALRSMEYADKVKATLYAKMLVGSEQKAAMLIQAQARGFLERRRLRAVEAAREEEAAMDALVEKERSLQRQRRLDRVRLEEEEEEAKAGSEVGARRATEQATRFGEGRKVVFEDVVEVPVERRAGGHEVVRLRVVVVEILAPYQLRLEAAMEEEGRGARAAAAAAFHRKVDIGVLETLLQPMFAATEKLSRGGDRKDGEEDQDEDQDEDSQAMLRWARQGRPPRRRQLVRWVLQRMWVDESDAGELELCLGSVAAAQGGDLDRTFTAALPPSSPLRSLRRAAKPGSRAQAKKTSSSPNPNPNPSPSPSKKGARGRTRDAFKVRYTMER